MKMSRKLFSNVREASNPKCSPFGAIGTRPMALFAIVLTGLIGLCNVSTADTEQPMTMNLKDVNYHSDQRKTRLQQATLPLTLDYQALKEDVSRLEVTVVINQRKMKKSGRYYF